MKMIQKHLMVIVLLAALTQISACMSPAGRYVLYRLWPDRAPIKGSKEIVVKGLNREVNILLDAHGVPHIQADNINDLFFGFGYMQGRDRRFQLETLRMMSQGRMREFIGTIDTSGAMARLELFSRMIGLYRDGERLIREASPKEMVLLEAFSAGINAATEREPTPMEFRMLDYRPEPWTPRDTGILLALISFGLCKNWEMELGRMELIVHQLRTGGTIKRALEIWKPRVYLGPHLINPEGTSDPFADIAPMAPELAEYLNNHFKDNVSLIPSTVKRKGDSQGHPLTALLLRDISTSNNWAMGKDWTRTGKGAFSSDPHMPHMIPSLGYLAHLACKGCDEGDYNIIGATFVGLPGIVFGTNGRLAWGPTSNWADVTDMVVEKPADPEGRTYWLGDKIVSFEVREEIFKIRQKNGTYTSETRTVRESRHGVIVNDFVERIPADFPLMALQRSSDLGKPVSALDRLYHSDTVTDAKEALFGFYAMVGHWALSDSTGQVAYFGPLHLPRRDNALGTVPVPGWIEKYEWQGYYPIQDLPYVINPQQGWIGSANNQVIHPDAFGHPINFEGDVPYRFQRISAFLSRGTDGRPLVDQISDQQRDHVDVGWLDVKGHFSEALASFKEAEDKILAEAADILLAWDGDTGPDAIGPSLFHTLGAHILENTMSDEVTADSLYFLMTYFNIEPLVYGILRDPLNPAWDDRRTAETETAEEVIRTCFLETVQTLRHHYGDDPDEWIWNDIAPWIIEHPFGKSKILARYLNRRAPTQGSGNTVAKHQFERAGKYTFPIKFGPVLRIMVDLNNLAGSKMSLPGGQSGRPASKHYEDLLPLFLNADGVSMDMNFARINQRAVGNILLKPGNVKGE